MMPQSIVDYVDIAINDMTPSLRDELTETCSYIFSTPDFVEFYSPKPATHLRLSRFSTGEISYYFFYLKEGDKSVVFGPVNLGKSILVDLPKSLGCRQVNIIRMIELPSYLKLPLFRVSVNIMTNNMIIKLPNNKTDYLHSLGSHYKKNLPKYFRRIQNKYGFGFKCCIYKNEEISKDIFNKLVEFNKLRIQEKGGCSLLSDDLTHRRWLMSQRSGVFCGLYNEDQLLGGAVAYLHKNVAYDAIVAHNPDYNELRIGLLSNWMLINYFIDNKVEEFHLLWGKSIWKERFGAYETFLNEVIIYDKILNKYIAIFKKSRLFIKAIGIKYVSYIISRLTNVNRFKH